MDRATCESRKTTRKDFFHRMAAQYRQLAEIAANGAGANPPWRWMQARGDAPSGATPAVDNMKKPLLETLASH
jgi:hypothetical protein